MAKSLSKRRISKSAAAIGIGGVAGMGGGTALVKYFQSLSEAAPYKNELILIAPSLTIILQWSILYVIMPLAIYWGRKLKYSFTDKQLSDLTEIVDRADIEPEKKETLRNQIREARYDLLEREINVIKDGQPPNGE